MDRRPAPPGGLPDFRLAEPRQDETPPPLRPQRFRPGEGRATVCVWMICALRRRNMDPPRSPCLRQTRTSGPGLESGDDPKPTSDLGNCNGQGTSFRGRDAARRPGRARGRPAVRCGQPGGGGGTGRGESAGLHARGPGGDRAARGHRSLRCLGLCQGQGELRAALPGGAAGGGRATLVLCLQPGDEGAPADRDRGGGRRGRLRRGDCEEAREDTAVEGGRPHAAHPDAALPDGTGLPHLPRLGGGRPDRGGHGGGRAALRLHGERRRAAYRLAGRRGRHRGPARRLRGGALPLHRRRAPPRRQRQPHPRGPARRQSAAHRRRGVQWLPGGDLPRQPASDPPLQPAGVRPRRADAGAGALGGRGGLRGELGRVGQPGPSGGGPHVPRRALVAAGVPGGIAGRCRRWTAWT